MDDRSLHLSEMTTEQLLQAARATIKGAEYCFFVTVGSDGKPNARLMQPFEPETDLTMWFGASPKSRKIKDLEHSNQVTLAFYDSVATAYLSVIGTAEVVRDIEMREKFWRVFWNDIYPGGPEGDDYVLIKVIPERMEMMNFTKKTMSRPYGLNPTRLARRGASWEISERGM
jgi:general stress protein 26